ncbi:hypothetical protein BDN67DRAFT_871509, partial [Paxillus ammoniavirescens]
TPKRSTQTLGSHEVWEKAHAAFKPLLNGVQTEKDLLELKAQLLGIRQEQAKELQMESIHDPPIIQHKGRPQTARITSSREGQLRGGGTSKRYLRSRQAPPNEPDENTEDEVPPSQAMPASLQLQPALLPATQRSQRKCGFCRNVGHTQTTCP